MMKMLRWMNILPVFQHNSDILRPQGLFYVLGIQQWWGLGETSIKLPLGAPRSVEGASRNHTLVQLSDAHWPHLYSSASTFVMLFPTQSQLLRVPLTFCPRLFTASGWNTSWTHCALTQMQSGRVIEYTLHGT